MNQKRDYKSIKSKKRSSFFKSGILSMLVCLGAQLAQANEITGTSNEEKVKTVQSTVTGTVTDDLGTPLPGTNVVEKGTTNGTQTDFDGNYTLNVEPGATLVFSYLGFQRKEVAVNGQSVVNTSLAEDAAALDEVVVTGYQVQTKRETTAAVSIVAAEDLAAVPSGNIEQQLQGRVAGVTVLTNGQPGTTSQIRVRGFNSFGNNAPLYVVDGVPTTNVDFINPDDVETATVLKDAAAASIYGARAANGVIVYTTKQGSRAKRKTSMTLNVNSGVVDPNVAGSPKMLNPLDMARYTHIGYENNAAANGTAVQYTHPQYGTSATPTIPDYLHANGQNGVSAGDVDLAAVRAAYEADPGNTFLIRPNLQGTNWYKEITRIAPQSRVSLGFDGGNENGRFYMGVSAQNQDGIVLGQEFSRYAARFNSEWDVTPWLSIGENFQVTYRSAVGIAGGAGGVESADDESEVLSAFRMPTIIPVYDEFGSFASTKAAGFNNPRNPVRRLKLNNGDDKTYSIGGFGNMYALIKPFEGLTLRSSLGGSYSNYHYVDYNYKYLGDSEPEASNSFGEGSGYGFSWTFTNTASYEKLFGEHKITALAGIEALNTGRGRNISGNGINPFSTDLDFQSLSVVQSPVVRSNQYKGSTYFSTFGKLDYNFNEKYYLTGVLRRDGSSRFGENNRYGTFPAVSAAWRVIDEPFMQNQEIISDLKIRGGWGEMGSDTNVSPNNQYSLFASDRGNTFYPIDGQNSGANEGFAASRIGNPNAQWETSETTNIGFDLSLFNNKLEFILDWWKKDTRDLLYQVPLPGVSGNYAAAPSVNIGGMSNKGVDFQIIGRGNFTEDLSFEVTSTNSFLKNEITALAPGIDAFGDNISYRGIAPIRNSVGESISTFFGYNVIGYFNSADEVTNSPAQDGKGIGRFRYEDVNGDGAITPDDRTVIGSAVPDFTGGLDLILRYKNLEFQTYWYGSVGNEIFNMSKWFTDFYGTFEGSAKGVAAFQSWTPQLGNNAGAPIWESASNLSTSGASNSWYVEDGSYLRLVQLRVGYNFNTNLVESLGLRKFSVGLSANNIWTLTDYSGLDPQVAGPDTNFGVDVGNFPVTPSYAITLEIGI
ncbi:SusC/RagA family TonB-linked outer membrane protein [Maribacter hydrothermalis]|uniref:SusC/RagA family protein n=1 Tax=Maribacter hydrothermalis TaxID=1836467 RepID=A0A1B7ZD92_9FLAO|nr:TonB-dependent receptor [Maribacter hydrothermalis]APQ18477.1 SusC/RagA family protein [Maribacter hydrothermalis]OBR41316.1 SusC/RagA family protein [Maribacter hydrothermalis]